MDKSVTNEIPTVSWRRRIDLLLKPSWTYQDIMEFGSVSSATAIKLKKTAICDYEGRIAGVAHCVKIDSALNAMGTSLKDECQKYRDIGLAEILKASAANQ